MYLLPMYLSLSPHMDSYSWGGIGGISYKYACPVVRDTARQKVAVSDFLWTTAAFHNFVLHKKYKTPTFLRCDTVPYCETPPWFTQNPRPQLLKMGHSGCVTCNQIGLSSWNSWIGVGDCFYRQMPRAWRSISHFSVNGTGWYTKATELL